MYRIRRCSLPVSELHTKVQFTIRERTAFPTLYENRASCTVFNPSFSGAETHILASFPYIRVRDKDNNGYCLRVQTRERMAFTAIRGRLSCIVECTKKNCLFTVREGERVLGRERKPCPERGCLSPLRIKHFLRRFL